MPTIQRLVERRGGPAEVQTVQKETPALDAIRQMDAADIHALLVMDGDDVVGIVTTTDYVKNIALLEKPSSTAVSEIMTREPAVITPDTTVHKALATMSKSGFHHLPVFDGKTAVAMVSMSDLVQDISRDKDATIRYLHDWLSGGYTAPES